MPIDHVVEVDIDYIYSCMKAMEDITLREIEKEEEEIGLITVEKITPHEVYSVFVIKMIE